MEFKPSPGPTVGVEWELQLLDPLTLDLIPGIIPLMEFFPDTTFIKPENFQCCVELNSCISDNSDQAIAHIRGSLLKLLQRCKELDMVVCGSGTHPFCRRLALITPLPRYEELKKESGYLAHVQIAFSTHVHIGMSCGDDAIHAMTLLNPAIPAFIALSANSPFWRGHETGHAAYRHRILAAARTYGIPPAFSNWLEFDKFVSAATRSGMIQSIKDIHWDIRPHPDFGTLEIRVMDSATDLPTLHGLVGFARTLALCFKEASAADIGKVLPLDLPDWITRENRYRAANFGLDADYIVNAQGQFRPLRDLIADLFELCEPTAKLIDEEFALQLARNLLETGSGYRNQLSAYEENHSARSVAKTLTKALMEGVTASDKS